MDVVAIFGPTGVGKTAVAVALARLLRERGEDPVAISADALQVYRGLETLTGAGDATRGPRDRPAVGASRSPGSSPRARSPSARTPRSTPRSRRGRRPIVVGGTGLYLRAALTELQPQAAAPAGPARADRGRHGGPRPGRAARRPGRARARAGGRDRPERPQPRSCARSSCSTMGESLDDYGDQLWTDEMRVPTRLFGLVMDRDGAVRADRRPRRRDGRGRAPPTRCAPPTPPAPRAPRARRSASASCSRTTSTR